MAKKPIELRLLAGSEDIDVPAADASRAGQIRIIGKSWSDEEERWILSSEPTRIVCTGNDAHADLSYYQKLVRKGEVQPADEATAKLIGGKAPTTKKAPKSAEGVS